jgi:hypothetical protein
VFIFNKFYCHAGAFGGVIYLYGEEEIANDGEDSFISLLLHTVQLQQLFLEETPSWPWFLDPIEKTGRKIHLTRFNEATQGRSGSGSI